MTTKYLKINPADNVAVALQPLHAGDIVTLDATTLTLRADIPAGHKFLLTDACEGDNIVKYGFPIGHLRADTRAGELVDHHNLATNLAGLLNYEYHPSFTPEQLDAHADATVDFDTDGLPQTFLGYKRRNGDVGIRNELWIVPTVGCVNGVCEQIAKAFPDAPVVAFPHNYGCSQLSDDHENTRKILRDLVLHPNAGGVLVVGLGCENNQPRDFEQMLGDYDRERIRFLITQEVEGDEVEVGIGIARELLALMQRDVRTETPLSALRIGLKCGGSDGFSGITANPLLGVVSDYVVSQGGTTVLTEVPEMFGAETILMNRCADRSLFDQTVSLINDFKQYFLNHGEPVGENPSPGNKAGGISTLEEKALGCTQKCGKSAVRGVLSYGDRLTTTGLHLLSAPGNDLVASTALAASSCHMVLFTTGRGTPFGTFVPTLKISTNSTLAQRKPHWIDFNAGALIEDTPMAQLFRQFIAKIITIANGAPSWNERNGYHEIA
ncbi:MAG: altronate dehydratase, partial [Prevotellaceae bacterium]|nr:altronate dehydratase [Prevotellaceae bacterium]